MHRSNMMSAQNTIFPTPLLTSTALSDFPLQYVRGHPAFLYSFLEYIVFGSIQKPNRFFLVYANHDLKPN